MEAAQIQLPVQTGLNSSRCQTGCLYYEAAYPQLDEIHACIDNLGEACVLRACLSRYGGARCESAVARTGRSWQLMQDDHHHFHRNGVRNQQTRPQSIQRATKVKAHTFELHGEHDRLLPGRQQ
jgi:hypothetical protein